MWFPVGMEPLGAIGMSHLVVCAVQGRGVLSRFPQGCHLPCRLAAVSVLGLGLTVLLMHPQCIRIQGQVHSTKPGQCSTAQELQRDNVKTLLPALLFLDKSFCLSFLEKSF